MKKIITFMLLFFFGIQISFAGGYPGLYKGGYSFIDKELIDIIKINVNSAESLMNLEQRFSTNNMGEFGEYYQKMMTLVKNEKDYIDDYQKNEYLKILESQAVKEFISLYLPAISLMESSGNTKINPWNNQGIFQLYVMEDLVTSLNSKRANCNSRNYTDGNGKTRPTRPYFTPCNKIVGTYKKSSVLTEEQFLYQLADVGVFASYKYQGLNGRLSGTTGIKLFSYKENLDGIISSFPELGLNTTTKNELISNILTKNEGYLNNFIQKHIDILKQYNIISAKDMIIWLDYIKLGVVGSLYNGGGNIGLNILDNNYISNYVDGNMCFYTIKTDGGKLGNEVKKTNGMLVNYLKYTYPEDANYKVISFIALIKKMDNSGRMSLLGPSCK